MADHLGNEHIADRNYVNSLFGKSLILVQYFNSSSLILQTRLSNVPLLVKNYSNKNNPEIHH